MLNKVSEIQISYTYPSDHNDSPKAISSRDIYKLVLDNWNQDLLELQEEFKIVLLNRANRVLGICSISKGGMAGTIVDSKLIFAVALKAAAHNIVLIHNHPSRNLTPSPQDVAITNKLVSAGKLLDLNVLDHLIISAEGYYSFADEGNL